MQIRPWSADGRMNIISPSVPSLHRQQQYDVTRRIAVIFEIHKCTRERSFNNKSLSALANCCYSSRTQPITMLFVSRTIAVLASVAAASPLASRQIAIPPDWTWHVTGSEMGCSRGGCYYNFNVTVPTVPGQIAGVKAYCSGYEDGYDAQGP